MNVTDNTSIRLSTVECPVCLDVYKEPRILECGHSLCQMCIIDIVSSISSKLDEDEMIIECPICCSNTNITNKGIGSLKINYALKDIVDSVNSQNIKPEQKSQNIKPEQKSQSLPIEMIGKKNDDELDVFQFEFDPKDSEIKNEKSKKNEKNEKVFNLFSSQSTGNNRTCCNILSTSSFSAPY